MKQDPVDVLDPNSLPSDPREMALRLLGMTAAELKGIDEKVVSGRNSVGGVRTDLNKIVQDFNNNLRPTQQSQQVIPPQHKPVVPVQPQVVEQIPTSPTPVPHQAPTIINESDDDQLEFDFYKKVKPEDLEYQLRLINKNLTEVNDKVNLIIDFLKKNYQVVDANQDQ